jgi:deoxyribonuclease-4
MSVAGGVHTAVGRGVRCGCTAMQIFVKNNNRWEGKPLADEDIANYKAALANASIDPVVAHAGYLINLCAPAAPLRARSVASFADELQRSERLGLRALIVHPGAHVGTGEAEGIARAAESLNRAHAATPGFRVLTTLETTAGQGSALGHRFEQLARIIELVDERHRMAVCVDTCHLYAAGYDIAREGGWPAVMDEFEAVIGLSRLAAVHVNDSKKGLASRVDRHDHIGKGVIGLDAFRSVMNDPRLDRVPKILETPKSDDLHEDVENMALLRSLREAVAERAQD